MKRNIFVIATISMLLLSCFMITPAIGKINGTKPPSNGNIIHVGGQGPNNYSTIQEGIDAASPGDTVFVYDYSSPYYENVVVNKTIDLIGESTKDTIINASGIVVNVSADNVNISGFTIKGYTNCSTLQYFDYNDAAYYWIIPDDWGDDYFNMRFTPEGECKLTTCEFTFYYEDGINGSVVNTTEGVDIIVWDDDGSGFPDTELARVNIHPDDINWWPVNTAVDFTSFNLVFDSDFHIGYTTVNQSEDVYAIISDDGSYGTNRSSEYYNGAWGSMLDDWGIDVNFFITANVSCSGTGISLSDSDNCRIINNNLKKNKLGINVEESSNNNTIYHNNFKDNYQHAYDNGSNTWDNGTEGNYWDDYTGNDSDGDGIGDTPYDILGGDNQDRYPLMEPYGEEEEPPEVIITIEEERPQNNTSNVGIDLSNVSVYASIDYDPWPSLLTADEGAYCEIGGDNITTTISTAYFPGRKEAPVDDENPLEYGTTYTWYVNVSLSLTNVHVWRNETFCFTTEGYNEPPVANYNYSINDLTVTFNASSSYDPDGDIENYTWDFGDGNHSYGVVTSHTYETDGNYIVTLTVTDNDSATDTMQKYVDLINYAPIADFDYFIDGKTVSFDASNSSDENGTIVSYYWDFGDGTNGTGMKPEPHEYGEDYTTYEVTLTVNDSAGASDSLSINVTTGDGTDPTVDILKPVKKGVYIRNDYKISRIIGMPLIIGDITIEVNATDEGSGVNPEKVKVHIDTFRPFAKQILNATDPDGDGIYTCLWEKNVIFRFLHVHTIKVVVEDNAGNTATSETLLVRRFL